MIRALIFLLLCPWICFAGQTSSTLNSAKRIWHFNEGTGISVLDSAQGTNGTATAIAWVNGIYGKMLSMDGGTSRVLVPEFNLAPKWSICSWFYKTTNVYSDGTAEFILAKDIDGARSFSYGIAGKGGTFDTFRFYTEIWSAGSYNSVGGTREFGMNKWYFYCVVANGNTAKTFVNAEEINSVSFGVIDSVTASTYIGRRAYSGAESYFKGNIEELIVLDKALSIGEIKKMYADGKGTYVR